MVSYQFWTAINGRPTMFLWYTRPCGSKQYFVYSRPRSTYVKLQYFLSNYSITVNFYHIVTGNWNLIMLILPTFKMLKVIGYWKALNEYCELSLFQIWNALNLISLLQFVKYHTTYYWICRKQVNSFKSSRFVQSLHF